MSDLLPIHAFRPPQPCGFNLSDMIQDVCESLEPLAMNRRVQIEIDTPPYLMWNADPDQMRWVLTGLVRNAIELTRRRGDVIVTVFEDEGEIEIEVADSRAAVTERQQHETPVEAGLVASIRIEDFDQWKKLLAANGGEIDASICPDGGVAFTITLPRPDANERRRRMAA